MHAMACHPGRGRGEPCLCDHRTSPEDSTLREKRRTRTHGPCLSSPARGTQKSRSHRSRSEMLFASGEGGKLVKGHTLSL